MISRLEAPIALELDASDEASALCEAIRQRWRRCAWIAAATYVVGAPNLSPIVHVLHSGSAARGLVLTAIPAFGSLWVAVGRPRELAGKRFDLVTFWILLVVLVQAVAAYETLGAGYLRHIVPAVALLALGQAGRGPLPNMSVPELRRALTGFATPMVALLSLGWLAQIVHWVPSNLPSSFVLSIHGARFEGLAVHPDALGFLAAVVTIIALVAEPTSSVWVLRVLGLISLLASNSRTALVVLGVGAFVVALFGPGRSLGKRTVALSALGLAGLALWGVIDTRRANAPDVLSGRPFIWHQLATYLHGLPFFGYGPQFVTRQTEAIFGLYSAVFDAQNQWLNDALNFGLVEAGILSIVFIVIALKGPLVYRRLVVFAFIAMTFVEGFSEVPIDLWASTVQAFPLFLLLVMTPTPQTGALGESHVG